MTPLKTFEPPKNGEKILTPISRILILILFCGIIGLVLGQYLIPYFFKFKEWWISGLISTVIFLSLLFFIPLLDYRLLKFIVGGIVSDVYYFENYIQIPNIGGKISYHFIDNFLFDEETRRVRITFIPISNDNSEGLSVDGKSLKPQWMKVNSKYKNVPTDLVNFLNIKVSQYKIEHLRLVKEELQVEKEELMKRKTELETEMEKNKREIKGDIDDKSKLN